MKSKIKTKSPLFIFEKSLVSRFAAVNRQFLAAIISGNSPLSPSQVRSTTRMQLIVAQNVGQNPSHSLFLNTKTGSVADGKRQRTHSNKAKRKTSGTRDPSFLICFLSLSKAPVTQLPTFSFPISGFNLEEINMEYITKGLEADWFLYHEFSIDKQNGRYVYTERRRR